MCPDCGCCGECCVCYLLEVDPEASEEESYDDGQDTTE